MKMLETFHFARTALEAAALSMISKRAGMRHIANRLSELPGVPVKIGQLLAMKTEVDLSSKQQNYQMPQQVVLKILAQAVPRLLDEIVAIDSVAKVASLSQVHRATLRDGRVVAIKIQFPGISQTMNEQLEVAFDALKKYGPGAVADQGLDQFKDYFRKSLLRELDYEFELKSQENFREQFKECSDLVVPLAYPELSGATILTQEYIAADSIGEICFFSEIEKQRFCKQLISIQLEGIFKNGFVHGDLHPGNWGYDRKREKIVLYDFGSVLHIPRSQSKALASLVQLGSDASSIEYLALYTDLGFETGKMIQIADVLPELTDLICEPLRRTENWNIKGWQLSDRVNTLLGDRKWYFRLAGPTWFLGLMRSCHGIAYAINKLGISISVLDIFREVVGNVGSQNRISRPVATTLAIDSFSGSNVSKNLKIQIKDGVNEIVYLEFPAHSAGNLEGLIPEDIKKKIELEGVSLSGISKKAIHSKFAPQELFSAHFQVRTYRVWLE